MSSPSLIYVLVEDNRQQSFIRRFLMMVGIEKRKMVFAPVPDGHGSGKQWVRRNFAAQAQICRRRNSRASTSMFAMMDADELTVARCLSDLNDELIKSGQQGLDNDHDRIARLIPKWNIETWILFLTSDEDANLSVREEQNYKDSKKSQQWDQLVPRSTTAIYALTRPGAALPDNLIGSLRTGLKEISRALPVRR
jgi:hypothetical protein